MSAYKKNILVGVTALVALLLLGYMILKFGRLPAQWLVEGQMPVHFVADRAEGVSEGSAVYYRGINVGKVSQIRLAPDEEHVLLDATIDRKWSIPGNVSGAIRTQGLIGASAAIFLRLDNPANPGPPLHDDQQIPAEFVGVDVLPPEYAQLARELSETARQLRESNVIGHLDQTVLAVQKQVQKAGEVLDGLSTLVNDPRMRADVQQAIANIRTATETANRVGTDLEKVSAKLQDVGAEAQTTIRRTDARMADLTQQLSGRLEQVAKLLETFQSISTKVDQGRGTAGLLVNDPKLYQGMVEVTQQLSATIADLKRVIEQWEQEGVTFKLD
jgi:phospholipid/cholesterol/gamma-HCH transport system substrate-binding protein